jgi:hypothetical protein
MAADKYAADPDTLSTPATDVATVVPSDTADLAHVSKALNAATAGTVRVTTERGTVADVFLAPGVVFPLRVRRVWATGTTATGLRALI